MTSHPSVGLSRPQFRAPSRTTSQTQYPSSGLASKHVLIDLTDAVRGNWDGEGPSKRRKTENDSCAIQDDGGRTGPAGRNDGNSDSSRQASSRRQVLPFEAQLAQAHFDSPSNLSPSVLPSGMSSGGVERSQSLPPLPMRPGNHTPSRNSRLQRLAGFGKAPGREGVQAKPYVLEPPPFAPYFEQDRLADFFPWVGNHPEDVLSEQVTKQGFYDKTQISQNESNTARPSLYSIFKHKSGLQTLSALFVSALEQRQAHGRVTAGSTFKPPPRVTLTDTKREAWLKDLANPTVPLRRLSRTIPHGIRGKILLDQCLSKNIPTGRAVWLAKCVGANEIRAFKRKGTSGTFAMGGETKWIKDWTAFVEQFVDGVIGSCGGGHWRSNMTYAIRLSAHLYSEHLLDREHYLDWVLASLRVSNMDTVPIRLLVLQIIWKDLVQSRKYGRSLAETLLEKFHMAFASEEKELYTPVKRQLSELIRGLLITAPACFIIPSQWVDFEATLKSCLGPEQPDLTARYGRLVLRNKRLIEVGRLRKDEKGQSPREQLIRNLDSARAPLDVRQLSEMCLKTVTSQDAAIEVLLDWSSTPYREGQQGIYLTVRLLRKWNRLGYDTDKPILDFLASSRSIKALRKQSLYQLIAELVRSRHFSVGRYCQWLLARGVLSGRDALDQNDSCDVRLLAELPLQGLPAHTINLRRILLGGVLFSTADESRLVEGVKDMIRSHCADLFEMDSQIDVNREQVEDVKLSSMSWTVKSEISSWLRQVVAQKCDPVAMNDWKDINSQTGASAVTVDQLCFVRSILEEFQDFAILADVLKIASTSNDHNVLASVADTINYLFEIFSAIGAAFDLFESLIEQNRSVTASRPPTKLLLVSLIDLGARFSGEEQTVRQLCGQLAICEQKSAVAACSPVSDHMAEALQSAESNFNDEFEQLLTSGTIMDKQTMGRLFNTIMQRIENAWGHLEDDINNLGSLCSRLRVFEPKHFDGLMLVWVDHLLLSRTRPGLVQALLPLISTGCLSLRTVVSRSRVLLDDAKQEKARPFLARVSVDMLDLIAQLDLVQVSPMNQATYRFRLEQRRFSNARPLDAIYIINRAVEHGSADEDKDTKLKLQSLLASMRVMSLLRYLLVDHTEAVQHDFSPASQQISPAAALNVKQVINGLLDPGQVNDLSELDLEIQVTRLVEMADEFSLPFRQLKLRNIFEIEQRSISSSVDGAQTNIVTALFGGVKTAVASGNTTWPILLSVLDDRIARQIREEAEEQLLSAMPTLHSSQSYDDDGLRLSKIKADISMSIIQALAYSIPEGGALQMGPVLADKMNILVQAQQHQSSKSDKQQSAHVTSVEHGQHLSYNYYWIDVLLRLILLHRQSFQRSKTGPNDQSRVLIALSALLLHPHLRKNPTLLEYLFDVASILVDDLPDTARAQCIRFLKEKDKSRDPRLRFLFGYGGSAEEEGDWLRVEQRGKVGPVYPLKWWEVIQEPTPNVGENDTFLSLGLFRARKG